MNAAYPIGFIGLGTMGEAMALTLVQAGKRLLVWNRTPAKAESLAAAGRMLIVVMICDTGERYVSSALFGFD